jgi:hypothetical protein
MVRPKRKPKPIAHLHIKLAPEEDQALADEATRRNCTKAEIVRAWIAALPKGKSSKG